MAENPFDSIENAQEYLRLLASEVETVRNDIRRDVDEAARERAARRLDALHVVDYKLKQLALQLGASRQILSDLRKLRRLLVSDRDAVAVAGPAPAGTGLPHV
jgi:pyridoxal biosynthesis lyase PdxS